MKILITGANGFIGKNLIAHLEAHKDAAIYQYDIDTDERLLDTYCTDCDFVFHLAGVNRTQNPQDFMSGNFGVTSKLLEGLKKHNNRCPVMISSSIQATLSNPYGQSKQAGENLMFDYEKQTGSRVFIYRLPNVFGKWCRPNYNSVVATFCYNIANGLDITVSDSETLMTLVYIDDVVAELVRALGGVPTLKGEFCTVPVYHKVKLGDIAEKLYSFKKSRCERTIPDMSDEFTKKLYSTYLSYLPPNEFQYPLKMNADERGSFAEFIRTEERGQVSVNISKPGITKGNHWHHTKNEKFLVVSGTGIVRFRHIITNETSEYYVSGEKLEVIDIPPGYTHNIENLGTDDLVTIMWANELFNPDKPDTYFLEV